MIKQINEFIDWPALEEKLSPTDREVYEDMKSACQTLMDSESPNHEEVSKQIRAGQEFLITNPSLDPVSARELWREFVCSVSTTSSSLPSQPAVSTSSLTQCDGEKAAAKGINDTSVAESGEEAEMIHFLSYPRMKKRKYRRFIYCLENG